MVEQSVQYCVLNVAATPHPVGIYLQLLNGAHKQRVNYWGDNYATIQKPVERRPGFYLGKLFCWIEINKDEPAVKLDILDEVSLDDLDMRFPDNVGFNSRIFSYVFRERDHKLFVELTNEFGKKLSAGMAERIFRKLFDIPTTEPDVSVEITLIPDEDALEKVFAISHIKHLKIVLLMPNADDEADRADEIIERLKDQNVRRSETILTSDAKTGGLKIDEQTRAEAQVANHNGYVESDGTLSDGTPVFRSTRGYARIIRSILNEGESFIERALRLAEETIVRNRRS